MRAALRPLRDNVMTSVTHHPFGHMVVSLDVPARTEYDDVVDIVSGQVEAIVRLVGALPPPETSGSWPLHKLGR